MEEIITFDTAKLAKDKGFDWECMITAVEDTKYIYGTGYDYHNHNQYRNNVSIPTQSLLQKWLRDEHNIHLEIASHFLTIDVFKKVRKWYVYLDDEKIEIPYNTYEESLEQGLKEALKLIKENGLE